MKDGYYLAAYIEVNPIGNIYGFAERHDQNISLWEKRENKIKLIHYWELERHSGEKKHRLAFYDEEQAIDYITNLISQYGLKYDDLVEVWGTPQLHKDNRYLPTNDYNDYTYHSLCHLFSTIMFDTDCFYEQETLGLSVDLGSDCVLQPYDEKKKQFVGCYVNNGDMELFPIYSPGLLWACARNVFALEEGSLMALATACSSTMVSDDYDIEKITVLNRKETIAFINNLKISAERIIKVIDDRFSKEDNIISAVMKVIQTLSMKIMELNVIKAKEKFNFDTSKLNLALAGGFALNCPTNSYLMKKYGFKRLLSPPCVSDTGQSLGIALLSFYQRMDYIKFNMENAFHGDYANDLQSIINCEEYKEFIHSVDEFDVNTALNDLEESVIVWLDGRSEVGPRSLGNRSLIADPRYATVKDRLNVIKKRQWWRPVAPIVLNTEVQKWFDDGMDSPFMLRTFKISEKIQQSVIAISHEDGSSRIQTLSEEQEGCYLYKLLHAFHAKTGVPIVCNTSLNDKGEPIINTFAEAINFALRKNIFVVYVNGKRIELKNHLKYKENSPSKRWMSIRPKDDELEELIKKHNPHDAPLSTILFNMLTSVKDRNYNLQDKVDVRELNILTKMYMKKEELTEIDSIYWN